MNPHTGEVFHGLSEISEQLYLGTELVAVKPEEVEPLQQMKRHLRKKELRERPRLAFRDLETSHRRKQAFGE